MRTSWYREGGRSSLIYDRLLMITNCLFLMFHQKRWIKLFVIIVIVTHFSFHLLHFSVEKNLNTMEGWTQQREFIVTQRSLCSRHIFLLGIICHTNCDAQKNVNGDGLESTMAAMEGMSCEENISKTSFDQIWSSMTSLNFMAIAG